MSGYWANGFRLASDAWVGAGAGIWPTFSSSGQAKADTYQSQDGHDGINYWGYNCCWTIAWFDAYGNSLRVPDLVENYEMGHGLGLGHSSTGNAVMQENAPSTTLAADDINGLNAMYP